jgi:transcriptional regulator with XRE-family HTH domain
MRVNELSDTLEIMGRKIRDLRLSKGYKSHELFAIKYNLPKIHYWRIEKGKSNVTVKSLIRILSIHNIQISDFFRSLSGEFK